MYNIKGFQIEIMFSLPVFNLKTKLYKQAAATSRFVVMSLNLYVALVVVVAVAAGKSWSWLSLKYESPELHF